MVTPEAEVTKADGSAQQFTVLDWIGTVVAGSTGLGLLLFPFASRTFASMFRDFGPAANLPALTRLVISGWFPMLLGLVVIAGVVAGVRRAGSLSKRRAVLVGAFVLGGVSFGVCLVGLYLPIFAIANAVKAD
jgi:hypothetical protein